MKHPKTETQQTKLHRSLRCVCVSTKHAETVQQRLCRPSPAQRCAGQQTRTPPRGTQHDHESNASTGYGPDGYHRQAPALRGGRTTTRQFKPCGATPESLVDTYMKKKSPVPFGKPSHHRQAPQRPAPSMSPKTPEDWCGSSTSSELKCAKLPHSSRASARKRG